MIAPPAPTLTPVSLPSLGVEVYFPTIDGSAVTITVWRIADGVKEPVAGALNAIPAGDFRVEDFLTPFGVVSTYVADITDAGGTTISGLSSTIEVDSDEVWISNPVDPEQSFTVELQAASLQGITKTTNMAKVYVLGMPRPFIQYLGEGSLSGVPLEIWSRTQDEHENMLSLTGVAQWVIRTPPLFTTLPRLLYVAIQSPSHTYFGLWDEDNPIIWTMTVDEAQPVSKAIIKPLVTWQDWMDAFPVAQASWSGTAHASTSTTPALIIPAVTNLVTNPSGETAATGYVAVPGTSGTAAVTNPRTVDTNYGARVLRTTWSVASTAAGGGVQYDVAVTAGQVLSCGLGRVLTSIGNRLQLSIEWRTAGSTISTVSATAVQTTAATVYDLTTFKLENQTAPATTTIARIKLLSIAGTGYANWSIASFLETDELMANIGATLGKPFDGDSFLGATWNDVMAVYSAGTWTDAIRNSP